MTHRGLSLWTEEIRVEHLMAGLDLGSELEPTQGQKSGISFCLGSAQDQGSSLGS